MRLIWYNLFGCFDDKLTHWGINIFQSCCLHRLTAHDDFHPYLCWIPEIKTMMRIMTIKTIMTTMTIDTIMPIMTIKTIMRIMTLMTTWQIWKSSESCQSWKSWQSLLQRQLWQSRQSPQSYTPTMLPDILECKCPCPNAPMHDSNAIVDNTAHRQPLEHLPTTLDSFLPTYYS